jgi:hypothetical protein
MYLPNVHLSVKTLSIFLEIYVFSHKNGVKDAQQRCYLEPYLVVSGYAVL